MPRGIPTCSQEEKEMRVIEARLYGVTETARHYGMSTPAMYQWCAEYKDIYPPMTWEERQRQIADEIAFFGESGFRGPAAPPRHEQPLYQLAKDDIDPDSTVWETNYRKDGTVVRKTTIYDRKGREVIYTEACSEKSH